MNGYIKNLNEVFIKIKECEDGKDINEIWQRSINKADNIPKRIHINLLNSCDKQCIKKFTKELIDNFKSGLISNTFLKIKVSYNLLSCFDTLHLIISKFLYYHL